MPHEVMVVNCVASGFHPPDVNGLRFSQTI